MSRSLRYYLARHTYAGWHPNYVARRGEGPSGYYLYVVPRGVTPFTANPDLILLATPLSNRLLRPVSE